MESKQDHIKITRWRKMKLKLKSIGLDIHDATRDAHLLLGWDSTEWDFPECPMASKVLQKLQEANRIINEAYSIANKNSDNTLL